MKSVLKAFGNLLQQHPLAFVEADLAACLDLCLDVLRAPSAATRQCPTQVRQAEKISPANSDSRRRGVPTLCLPARPLDTKYPVVWLAFEKGATIDDFP